MDDFIATEMPIAGAPGLAYAVVEDGEIASGAYGEILAGSGRPVTPDTPFLIGSITKSFTAMAVMKLVESGRVDLDAEVSRYLDVFKDRPSGATTIRQLLSHTSGFSTWQGNDTHIDGPRSGDDLERQVERIAQWSPRYAPGARWQYSNANYLILGAVIEAVSGQDFASHMEAEILEPIGMDESFVAVGESHDAMAVGHQPWFGSKRPLGDNSTSRAGGPAGGVVATASDLALYLAVMMNGQDDVISAESKAAMLRPASAASPLYGFGWSIDANDGTFYHSGLTPGVETLAVLSPTERRGVVVLVNANSGLGFGENNGLFGGIVARALGRDDHSGESSWGPRSLFLMFALLPVIFVIGIVWAGLHRAGLRAKSGASGAFSLWFPLFTTLALAWTATYLIPQLFGVPLRTLSLYQPDFVLLLVATAATGVLWAVFRLAVFYSGKSSPGAGAVAET
ncbi:serine hydrolase domain-containing protein [Paraliomyxa miuraensis]|uniref:serine hydrolase domain-containing protein n=1 Tax=Paraliomyxa miuraensis TaxID=376150 RepID=UPI00225C2DEA|nr:serine hydrolase domain-containing protein [Paraliomyxa miuraensis]MCX4240026.1 beta-lactamase family protein [Paraliomyxa miuraensis]